MIALYTLESYQGTDEGWIDTGEVYELLSQAWHRANALSKAGPIRVVNSMTGDVCGTRWGHGRSKGR
jgi:hypothetical protein